MSMISNFQSWRERQDARQGAAPVDTTEEDHPLQSTPSEEEQLNRSVSSEESDSETPLVETFSLADGDDSEDSEDEELGLSSSNQEGNSPSNNGTRAVARAGGRRLSVADIEDERELQRRRTMFCLLVAGFLLFRMWIQAVAEEDFALLMVCLLGTSWTARFIRHTRYREEEFNRLIASYNDNPEGENGEGGGSLRELGRMSFQAQLAEAIIQSQMEMMRGGFGNPDGSSQNNTPGVSDDAMSQWSKFQFNSKQGLSDYTDVELGGGGGGKKCSLSDEEEPHCSICLGEYEDGEELVCLPCKHVYHEECVASWCSNHIRCPLCNFDLESVASSDTPEEV